MSTDKERGSVALTYDQLRAASARMGRDNDPRSCNEALAAVGIRTEPGRLGEKLLYDVATGELLARGDVVTAWALVYMREDAATRPHLSKDTAAAFEYDPPAYEAGVYLGLRDGTPLTGQWPTQRERVEYLDGFHDGRKEARTLGVNSFTPEAARKLAGEMAARNA